MKKIIMTEEEKDLLKKEFEEYLSKSRLLDGSFTYTKRFDETKIKDEDKPTIYYTSDAYVKISYLVKEFSSEVGWHGLVRRIDDKSFLIYDILVYDQVVTGATVNTDDEGYFEFMKNLTEDQAANMFYHGHSHVNMGVTPSTTDMAHRNGLLNTMKEDGFWIFQIWNKSGSISTALYDMQSNTLYENNDVNLAILDHSGMTINSFIAEAKTLVKPKQTSTTYQTATGTKLAKVEKSKKKESANLYQDWDDVYDGEKPYGQYNPAYCYPY